jgi:hypothetical protein
MSKFNAYRSEFILRRDDILIRLIHGEGLSISHLLLYRKRQNQVEDGLHTFGRKKYRLKSFNGINLRLKKNIKRNRTKKDILDWSFRRLPLT